MNERVWRTLAVMVAAVAVRGGTVWAATTVEEMLAPAPGQGIDEQTRERGAKIYAQHCATCHENSATRAPGPTVLRIMAPESILRSLTSGVMKPVVPGLSDAERRTVAEYLGQRPISDRVPQPRMCAKDASPFDYTEPPPFAGWGLEPGSPHAIAPAVAGLDEARLPRLALKWSLAFPNAVRARSQPALGGGALYIGSHDGSVFALDRQSGCARWVFHAGAEVRTGIVLSSWRSGDRSAKPVLVFGDLTGSVYAVDAATGAEIWKVKADPHPSATITGTPALFEDKLLVPVSSLEEASSADPRYQCCTFRGSLLALDARTGAKRWQTFMTEPPVQRGTTSAGTKRFGPSGVAIWSSPTVDVRRRRVYVTTGDSYSLPESPLSDAIVALDVDTGAKAWSYQATPGDVWTTSCILPDKSNCDDEDAPDYDFGATPILTQGSDGREVLLAGQKSGIVYAFDPATGKLRWQKKVGRGGYGGGVAFGIAAQNGLVFVPIADYGPSAEKEHAPQPGVHAVDIVTGKLVWSYKSGACGADTRCVPSFGGVPTPIGPVVLVGGDHGELLALNSKTGAPLWQYDTRREFQTVNGEIAKGGALAGGQGPIAYRGMVFVNSGYGFAGKLPGNVLLVFGSD